MLESTATARRHAQPTPAEAGFFLSAILRYATQVRVSMVVQLTLYTRSGCHLCEDMAQALAELASEGGFSVSSILIDNNAELEQKYGTRVPVLMLADRLICEYFLNPHALQQALSEHVDD